MHVVTKPVTQLGSSLAGRGHARVVRGVPGFPCGEPCPIYPGRRYEEWVLPDPAHQPLEVRPIRDDIEQRVRELLNGLGITTVT